MSRTFSGKVRFISPTADTLSGAGDSLNYFTPVPIRVLRYGYIISTALDTTQDLIVALNVQAAGATDVPVVTATITADAAVGDVVAVDVNAEVAESDGEDALGGAGYPPASKINVAPTGYVDVPGGSEVAIEITQGSTAGAGYGWIEFLEMDKDEDNYVGSLDVYTATAA